MQSEWVANFEIGTPDPLFDNPQSQSVIEQARIDVNELVAECESSDTIRLKMMNDQREENR